MEDLGSLFPEEEEKVQEKVKLTFERALGSIHLQLVNRHPLWGHELWNAGKWLSNYLDAHKELYENKRVIEFGAGAGLPSIICYLNNASLVVCTDYPDQSLIENITQNYERNRKNSADDNFVAIGFLWGAEISTLQVRNSFKYDLIILSDLLFNHSEHLKLIKSIKECLDVDGIVLCTFTHHRPWLAHKDMSFFELALEMGLESQFIESVKMSPMFEVDRGDELVRSTVHFYTLKHKKGSRH